MMSFTFLDMGLFLFLLLAVRFSFLLFSGGLDARRFTSLYTVYYKQIMTYIYKQMVLDEE
jgi:hypothetical protein